MKLKPCPFCGSPAAFHQIPDADESIPNAGGQYVECSKCGACTRLAFACMDDPKPMLADLWNRRTADSASLTQEPKA